MSRAERFADALNRLERDRDLDVFVDQFADSAVLVRPEPGGEQTGVDGARRFWQTYLDQFERVESTFERLVDAEDLSELEWVSDGQLASGGPIRYAGVSLLEHDSAGKVTRFATYYDTAAFAPKAVQGD